MEKGRARGGERDSERWRKGEREAEKEREREKEKKKMLSNQHQTCSKTLASVCTS